MQTAGTSSKIKNLNFVCAEHVSKNHSESSLRKDRPEDPRGVHGSLCRVLVLKYTGNSRQYPNLGHCFIHLYSIIASSEAERHASSKTALCTDTAEAQPGAPPMEVVLGPHGQSWEMPAVCSTCCAQRGSSTPYLCPKYFPLFPQTALVTRECISHCDVMKLIDFQSFT